MVETSAHRPEDKETPDVQAIPRPEPSLAISATRHAEELESRLYERTAAAVLMALLRTRGSAIVNIGDLDPAKIIPHLQREVAVVSAEQILNDKPDLEVEHSTLLVLTGYSSQFAADFERENTLQGFVRHHANQDRCNVLVLSEGMPSPEVFSLDHWWYNGPVPCGECFSIEHNAPEKIVLKEFYADGKSFRDPLAWKKRDKDDIEYKL